MTLDWRCPHGNGWWPRLSWPWIAYGNLGVWITHLETGETVRIREDVVCYARGWLNATTLRCTRLDGDDHFVFDVSVPSMTWGEDPTPRPGLLQVTASLGHWATWDRTSSIAFDGRVVATGYHSMRQHGRWIAGRHEADGYALRVFCDGAEQRRIAKQAEVFDWATLGEGPLAGTCVYGRPQVIAAYPGGGQQDVTRSPGGEGAADGSHQGGLQLLDVDGTPWLWSVGAIGRDRWGVLGGVLGEPEVLVLDVEAATLDVQRVGGDFVVAANDGEGRLRVVSTPLTTPRSRITIPPAPLVVPEVPVIGRPCWFGYFFQWSAQYGDNPAAPCTATFVKDVEKLGAPAAIIAVDSIAAQAAPGTLIGIYATGGDVETLDADARRIRAALPELAHIPIWGCYDGGAGMPAAALPAVDVLGLECYVGAQETAADCEQRVRAYLATLPADRRVYLIGQSYTSNTGLTADPQQLLEAQVVPARIARDDARIAGILMFSDGRPTGTRDHEEWRPLHAAILAGIPGTPARPTTPEPPVVPAAESPPAPKKKKSWLSWD